MRGRRRRTGLPRTRDPWPIVVNTPCLLGERTRILRRFGSRHPRVDLPMITFPASWVFVRLELSTAEFILTSARVPGGVARAPCIFKSCASSFKNLIRTGASTDPQVQRSNRTHKFVRVAAGLRSRRIDSVTEFFWRVPLVVTRAACTR